MYAKTWKHIYKVAKPYKVSFIFCLVALTAGIALDLLKQVYLEKIVDAAVAGLPIIQYVTYFGLTILAVVIAYGIFDYLLIVSQKNTFRDLYNYAYNHLVEHSYVFFTNSFGGSLVSKVKRFANSFIPLQDSYVFNVHMAIVKVIVIFIILLQRSVSLAFVFFAWSLIYAFVSISLTRRQRTYDEYEATKETAVTAKLADIITNILTVKMFATRKKEKKTFEDSTAEYEHSIGKSWMYSWKIWRVQASMFAVIEVIALIISYQGLQNGTLTIGTLVLVQTMIMDLFGSLWNLGKGIQRMSKSLSEMKEMVDIIDQPLSVVDAEDPLPCQIKRGDIIFDNVSFKYDKKYVLRSFDLHIKAGEKVGLVGISGSGKSTITKLLLRFLDIHKGEIRIDGQNIALLRQEDLRSSITYVPQEPLLFHRSLKDNIAYTKKSTLAQVIEAAKKAHAHQFIMQFPDQYKTLVGERGVKLSGGERQRVAIARAIIKDAPVLIMDEATSSLDTISENYIRDSIDKLMKNKTAIIIAHRLSTVQQLDRIIVLSKGKIVEEGTHKQLLKKKGAYYKLYQHQSL